MSAAREIATGHRRSVVWPWVLLAMLVGFGVLTLQVLDALALLDLPFSLSIDGLGQFDGLTLSQLTDGRKLLVATGLVFALVIGAIVVPMALLLAFLCAGLGILLALVCGIGLPAVLLVLTGVLLLSPLWVPALLIGWLVSRSRRASRAPAAATIAA